MVFQRDISNKRVKSQIGSDSINNASLDSEEIYQTPHSFAPDATKKPLATGQVLHLQRLLGNQRTQVLLANQTSTSSASLGSIQRAPAPDGARGNPGIFKAWLMQEPEWNKYYNISPQLAAGKCDQAAKWIGNRLADEGFKLYYTAIRNPDGGPENHFVIVVTIGDALVVVDATMHQFIGCAPTIAPINEWRGQMDGAREGELKQKSSREYGLFGKKTTNLVWRERKHGGNWNKEYQDFATVDEAVAWAKEKLIE